MFPKYPRHKRIKEKRLTDPAHLDMVRQLPCVVCFEDKSDIHRAAHHLLRGTVRGMGRKAPDSSVIPLCSGCHAQLHQSGDEDAFLVKNGLYDAVRLAEALYNSNGYEDAWHIVCHAKQDG